MSWLADLLGVTGNIFRIGLKGNDGTLCGSPDADIYIGVAEGTSVGTIHFCKLNPALVPSDYGIIATDGVLNWAGVVRAGVFQQNVQTVGYASSLTVSVDIASIIDTLLTGNIATLNYAGGVDGQHIVHRLRQDGSGGHTVAFGSTVRFGTTIAAAVVATGAGKLSYLELRYNAADAKYDVIAFNTGF